MAPHNKLTVALPMSARDENAKSGRHVWIQESLQWQREKIAIASYSSVCDNFVASLNEKGCRVKWWRGHFLPQNFSRSSHNPNSYEDEESTRLLYPMESRVSILRRCAVLIVKSEMSVKWLWGTGYIKSTVDRIGNDSADTIPASLCSPESPPISGLEMGRSPTEHVEFVGENCIKPPCLSLNHEIKI